MVYKYDENAILNELLESYRQDGKLYITDSSIRFPERDNVFTELRMLRALLFPTYWNCGEIRENKELLRAKMDELGRTFFDGIILHLSNDKIAEEISHKVLASLPGVRDVLKKDIEAAFEGDPAARSYTEIIRAYPGFGAILVQRVAHVLYELNVLSYSRELTELAHSMTGIDIHPGAKIGMYFFIDHGTGVVIGETTEIGNHVRIYQSVTLGALHFEKDEGGMLRKGYKRHPTIGNYVVIGAGAKILGPVSVGSHVSIGANAWVTEDIPDDTLVIPEHPKLIRKNNGIKNET